ncbi:23S rRNA pseudouridine1911/1915/1917 synthase [Acetitomaculum ruminis DSM 5522]|uniref:Pseudouridine synthase n=1 Tax=Acetitomaculum ruminis DSM 5522 TaxID=1120918 RepID=A0A1I0VLJ0_9FIRM|nr:RluA family pseudouridine synthase [Acetitomaculum ruminis]SFA77192.1 23S rRNA pseudouridine1911/1915/1917 synthase [Acetitomaculum ruminis DSM 5522]
MNRTITYNIKIEDTGKKIQDFLKENGLSSKLITRLKKTKEGILINGKWEYVNYVLKENDTLTIFIKDIFDENNILPTRMPLEIVYEDEDILVINKPAGMPVHPSINNYTNTLANAVTYYYKDEENFIFRCINRLDKDTTGLTIIAKNPLSGCLLYDMITKKMIKRTYLAIVRGMVYDSGTIDAPIARKSESIIERCVDYKSGEKAITHYKPILSSGKYSLLEIHLETGRTHQIRVHMDFIGHPLPGDFLYNPDYSIINRQALHSSCLDFPHPIDNKNMHFEIDMPNDMKKFFY